MKFETEQERAEHEATHQAVESALKADREAALRDVFAASALAALVSHSGGYSNAPMQLRQARDAYNYADAMLEARK